MILKDIFLDKRICALAGEQSTGKTNNLAFLIQDFRQYNKKTPILVYGVDETTLKWLMKLGNVLEISHLQQLSDKRDSLIIIEEFQKLRLNDKRYKYLLDELIDFVYHHNNWIIFSSPNLREYNSIIGCKIERWMLKSLKLSALVNGSQLKDIVINYRGRFKSIEDININPDRILVINDECEKVIKVGYIKEIDRKMDNANIFDVEKKSEKSQKKVKLCNRANNS